MTTVGALRVIAEAMLATAETTHEHAKTRQAEAYWDGRAQALRDVLDVMGKLEASAS